MMRKFRDRKLLVATHNVGKLEEISDLLTPYPMIAGLRSVRCTGLQGSIRQIGPKLPLVGILSSQCS